MDITWIEYAISVPKYYCTEVQITLSTSYLVVEKSAFADILSDAAYYITYCTQCTRLYTGKNVLLKSRMFI